MCIILIIIRRVCITYQELQFFAFFIYFFMRLVCITIVFNINNKKSAYLCTYEPELLYFFKPTLNNNNAGIIYNVDNSGKKAYPINVVLPIKYSNG